MSQEPPIPKELWDLIPAAAQAALLALLGQLQTELGDLRQQVADLNARLGQNSQNSSKPPSSDAPSVKRPPPREPSGRRRGGSAYRILFQIVEPDEGRDGLVRVLHIWHGAQRRRAP